VDLSPQREISKNVRRLIKLDHRKPFSTTLNKKSSEFSL
jgi:hypothetical protein